MGYLDRVDGAADDQQGPPGGSAGQQGVGQAHPEQTPVDGSAGGEDQPSPRLAGFGDRSPVTVLELFGQPGHQQSDWLTAGALSQGGEGIGWLAVGDQLGVVDYHGGWRFTVDQGADEFMVDDARVEGVTPG